MMAFVAGLVAGLVIGACIVFYFANKVIDEISRNIKR